MAEKTGGNYDDFFLSKENTQIPRSLARKKNLILDWVREVVVGQSLFCTLHNSPLSPA